MAVGVIIGGAFGKIVTSLVNDIITDLIGIHSSILESDDIINSTKMLCPDKNNKDIVKAYGKNGRLKNPKLDETCLYYGIEFDGDKYHSATYDVTKTYEILKRMNIKL